MTPTYLKIDGVPYSQVKPRGNLTGPSAWSGAIVEQTSSLPKIKEACVAKITFLLPPNKFPADFPYGPDLDNLVKRFMDALNKTVFSEAPGKDSCVISLSVSKSRVGDENQAGALLEILPVNVT